MTLLHSKFFFFGFMVMQDESLVSTRIKKTVPMAAKLCEQEGIAGSVSSVVGDTYIINKYFHFLCASIWTIRTSATQLTLSINQHVITIYDKAECSRKINLSFLLTVTLFDLSTSSISKHVAALSADPVLY